jgi:Pyruvate/2-oxoacid:ferredoxin oxidoreductase delta subunit
MQPKDIQKRAKDLRRTWAPDPALMALRPEVSGNAINGAGESRVRRPTPVYWQDPDTIAHGAMQRWFANRRMTDEVVAAYERREAILAAPLPDKAAVPRSQTPASWRGELDRLAPAIGADLIGAARFDAAWVYEGKAVPELPFAIMIGVAQDYETMSHVPDQIAGAEVLHQYGRVLAAARSLAGWILEQGWSAEPHGAPTPATFTMVPAAIAAGLGELGKHGSLINRSLGANFRLAAVLTDLPLETDRADVFGADDFCLRCRVCEEACPPDALAPDKQMVRGVERWYVDFDKCLPFFNEHLGCSICTTVCPWSQPGVADNLVEKFSAKARARPGSRRR